MPSWYQYLFARRVYSDIPWHTVIWCRIQNHPAGPIFYASDGVVEPDMHCKNCGDELY